MSKVPTTLKSIAAMKLNYFIFINLGAVTIIKGFIFHYLARVDNCNDVEYLNY